MGGWKCVCLCFCVCPLHKKVSGKKMESICQSILPRTNVSTSIRVISTGKEQKHLCCCYRIKYFKCIDDLITLKAHISSVTVEGHNYTQKLTK